MISMKSGRADNPSACAARESAVRSLTKPTKHRFARALLRSTKDIAIYSPAGIYLGKRLSYDVDLNRLCNVMERTTCGLYFYEFGQQLPDGHKCKSYALEGFEFADPQATLNVQQLWRYAVSGDKRTFDENVFTYWVRKVDGPEDATLWGFLVYGSVAFLVWTGPEVSPSTH
jgi:hypothetical protein